MPIDINLLINEISNNTPENSERELRAIAIDQRALPQDHESQIALAEKKQLYQYAIAFLKIHPSPSSYQDIAKWFYTHRKEFNEGEKIAVFAAYLQLKKTFAIALHPRDIILLGMHYFNEPYLYAGFLYWLIAHEVTPSEIANSGILSRYFESTIDDIDYLHHTYQLLSLFDNAQHYLKYFETVPCVMQQFSNLKKQIQDENYFTYNVVGSIFQHKDPFQHITNHANLSIKIQITDSIIIYASTLFTIFNWDFIRLIDFNNKSNIKILENILDSHADQIIPVLPSFFLTGRIHVQLVELILKIMAANPIVATHKNLKRLIDFNPFYLHLLQVSETLMRQFPAEYLLLTLKKLLGANCYKTVDHFYLLSQLCRSLQVHPILSSEIMTIKNLILDGMIIADTLMADEIAETVLELEGLRELANDRLTQISNHIKAIIERCILKKIDYDAVKTQWANNARQINIFIEIWRGFKLTSDYPFTIYNLRALILQKKWEYCENNNMDFNFKEAVRDSILMDCDKADDSAIQREIFETLVYSKNWLFIEYILNFLKTHFDIDKILQRPFGTKENLIQQAISKHNSILLNLLIPLYHLKLNQIIYFLEDAWLHGNLMAIRIFREKKLITQKTLDALLYSCYINRDDEKNDLDDFDDAAVLFCCQTSLDDDSVLPSKSVYIRLLEKAINHQRTGLVSILYSINPYHNGQSVRSALFYAYEISAWKILNDMTQRTDLQRWITPVLLELFFQAISKNEYDKLMRLFDTGKLQCTSADIAEGLKKVTINKNNQHVVAFLEKMQNNNIVSDEFGSRKRDRTSPALFTLNDEEDTMLLLSTIPEAAPTAN